MFGLFKEKVKKFDYGTILAANASQYIEESSIAIDKLFKTCPLEGRSTPDISTDINAILIIQLISLIAVGELSFYAMDKSNISTYEIRNGFLMHIEKLKGELEQKHSMVLDVNCTKASSELASLICNNKFVKDTGRFYNGNGFSSDDVYGIITLFTLNSLKLGEANISKYVGRREVQQGAIRYISSIDKSVRYVKEMYSSYKLV